MTGPRPKKRVCVITSGSIASTPRMLKVADAIEEAGYDVTVAHAEFAEWADRAAEAIAKTRAWQRCLVRWGRHSAPYRFWLTRIRHKVYRALVSKVGPSRFGLRSLALARCRIASEIIRRAGNAPGDLIYAGTSGGVAVGALVGRLAGRPFALDLEDYYAEESSGDAESVKAGRVMREIEGIVLKDARFLTAGSEAIASAYRQSYGVDPVPVNNVFSRPDVPPQLNEVPGRALRLFWFSQTVGPGRGLEDVFAVNSPRPPMVFQIVGRVSAGYAHELAQMASGCEGMRLELLGPVAPDRLACLVRQADVGLAIETGVPRNRDLCVTNKLFTYLSAGLAIAATATTGQQAIMQDVPDAGFLYRAGDGQALLRGLNRWVERPAALAKARLAAWQAARDRWHWEHPLERGAVLAAVGRAIGPP